MTADRDPAAAALLADWVGVAGLQGAALDALRDEIAAVSALIEGEVGAAVAALGALRAALDAAGADAAPVARLVGALQFQDAAGQRLAQIGAALEAVAAGTAPLERRSRAILRDGAAIPFPQQFRDDVISRLTLGALRLRVAARLDGGPAPEAAPADDGVDLF
ncbi:MAG TPA: hypothetical protein VEH84_01120 [Alphaproteobacteria bacterium]|nr:hypothetical protein [Alphaproteobacteria bacterium]